MKKSAKTVVSVVLSASLFACSSVQTSQTKSSSTITPTQSEVESYVMPKAPSTVIADGTITMEMIMADPDWIGRQPQNPFWSIDGSAILYQRKQAGSVVRDLWQLKIGQSGNGEKVGLNEQHLADNKDRVTHPLHGTSAWVFEGNIFVQTKNGFRQLTRSPLSPHNLSFLNDGRLAFQSGDSFYAIDTETGMTEQLVSWKYEKKSNANKTPRDYIAQEQVKLIDYVKVKRKNRQDRFDRNAALQAENSSLRAAPFYLSENHRTVAASLSPNGKWLIVSEQKAGSARSDEDIMPNYIGEDGRIKPERVRVRVAESKPLRQTLWLLDLASGKKSKLKYTNLPGFNEDVLETEKAENAAAKGETYETNRLPRDIGLIVDWYWDQSAIQWNTAGDEVAIMLEAWDNKDRWLASVDFNNAKLVSQHRMHDDAWVNYKFNSFGWLRDDSSLYYLSEQTGYAHLYVKPLNGKERAVTQGKFEVDELTLSKDGQYMYFQANKKHPGIHEIYRVDLSSGEIEALTDLNGRTTYSLSPDESKLLLTHSKLTVPPELYVQEVGVLENVSRVTNTVSEAFTKINWLEPEIVPVKSSNVSDPIYSRVYLPAGYDSGEKRRAVIFNHGAGYLQNSHLGWSGYFREFMFHNLLVQQGYVVMDMDYRASAGYGRDWRTAIYRHMGKPEVEDLKDGVNWLVENVNVDAKRIGTYGGSYGGFMTFMALFTEPDLFQAGAALRPVSDWAHYNHPYTSNILNVPDVDPIAYERSSPIYFAEGLNKPLLINAPMVDNNVFFVDVVRLVQRLIELEKEDFETAIYPVEPHGFVQPSSWLDEYRRIFKLFEENL